MNVMSWMVTQGVNVAPTQRPAARAPRLTPEVRAAIWARIQEGGATFAQIGREMKVSRSTVSLVNKAMSGQTLSTT